jgi:hypothetical protein
MRHDTGSKRDLPGDLRSPAHSRGTSGRVKAGTGAWQSKGRRPTCWNALPCRPSATRLPRGPIGAASRPGEAARPTRRTEDAQQHAERPALDGVKKVLQWRRATGASGHGPGADGCAGRQATSPRRPTARNDYKPTAAPGDMRGHEVVLPPAVAPSRFDRLAEARRPSSRRVVSPRLERRAHCRPIVLLRTLLPRSSCQERADRVVLQAAGRAFLHRRRGHELLEGGQP